MKNTNDLRHLYGSQYGIDTRRVVEQHLRSELDERASRAGLDVASVDLWWPWVNVCMALAHMRPTCRDGLGDEWRLAQVDVDELMTASRPEAIDRAFRVMYLDERSVPILRACVTRLEGPVTAPVTAPLTAEASPLLRHEPVPGRN